MALAWPPKDPDEVLDYSVDWTIRLAGDTISTSNFVVPSGITKNSQTNSAASATVWLSGGTIGQSYDILNHIVTTGGRTMEQTVKIKIKSR